MKFILLFLLSFSIYGKAEFFEDVAVNGKIETESLDVSNSSKPCPVKTNAEMLAIASPTNGQCVYNSNENSPYFYSTTELEWKQAAGSGGGGDNAFINGDFEAMTVGQGWSKSTGAGWFTSTDAFSGKKSIEIQFGGATANVWQLVSRPQWKGRKVKLTANYKLATDAWTTNIPELCVVNGTTSNTSHCVPVKSTGTGWALYEAEFIWFEDSHGIFVKNNTLVDLTNRIKLDNVRIYVSPNEAIEAMIDGQYQSELLSASSNVSTSTDLSILTSTRVRSNASIYTKSTTGITILQDADLSIVASSRAGSGGLVSCIINLTDSLGTRIVSMEGTTGTSSYGGSCSYNNFAKKGEVFTFVLEGANDKTISIKAKARSPMVIYPEESFDSSINNLKWSATACAENDIGCYNTFSYTANDATQAAVRCSTRPTQTDESIKQSGFLLFTRTYNANGTCLNPTHVQVQLPRALSDPSLFLYKDLLNSIMGGTNYTQSNDTKISGIFINNYSSKSGVLTLNNGIVISGNSERSYIFNDNTRATSAYVHFKSSKTGAGIQNKPARQVAYVSPPDAPNDITIYNDGYCEQRFSTSFTSVSASGAVEVIANNPIAMKDSVYGSMSEVLLNFNSLVIGGTHTKTSTGFRTHLRNVTSATASGAGSLFSEVKGYCAASALLPYGIKVAY